VAPRAVLPKIALPRAAPSHSTSAALSGDLIASKTANKTERPDWFDDLADSSLVRVQQIVSTPTNPKPLIKVSASTWWRMVRTGKAPQAVRVSTGITAWRVSELRNWLKSL
jgi:predicted DNA-binding transcriptional regulator AlpA